MDLYLIPARGGSKGLPGKNIKKINSKPLIIHSLEVAKACKHQNDIIHLSTDDIEIKQVAESYGFDVPFLRPEELSTDESTTIDVIKNVVYEFKERNITFEKIILLQPTTPFRNVNHLKAMMAMYSNNIDMVVSVNLSKNNPYFNLFKESETGFLEICIDSNYKRRQDCPPIYQYNGSIYIINSEALEKYSAFPYFKKIVKYVMSDVYSIDIDTEIDFKIAEYILEKNNGKI